MWQVEKKRFFPVSLNEFDGLFRVAFCQGRLIGRRFDHLHAVHQWQRGIAALLLLHVVRVRNAVVLIEAVSGGKVLRLVAEVPFADAGRNVASAGEVLGQGDFVRMQPAAIARDQHPVARFLPHANRLAEDSSRSAGWLAKECKLDSTSKNR